MPKPILFIKTKDAVNDVRSGLSDVAMMQKYGVSASVLEKLFQKLVDTGQIDRSELDERMRSAEQSHVVDLVGFPGPELKKTRVNAKEAVSCVRSGMSDIALMEKFHISARGLDSLFRKLVQAREIGESELESRKHGVEWAEIVFAANADRPEPFQPDPSVEELAGGTRFKGLFENHKVAMAGIAGALIGALAVTGAFLLFQGAGPFTKVTDSAPTRTSTSSPPNESARETAQGVIPILKDIHEDHGGQRPTASAQGSPYEDCLKRCEGEFDPTDNMERALFFNCKKSCLQDHSEHFKRIRQRYHAPPSVKAP